MPTNRKFRAEVTRQVILDAAEEVFFEAGLSGATLEAIAQRSNVTRGAIYWHFTNKMEVFEAIFERTLSLYEALIADITNKATSLKEFEDFLIKLLQDIAGDPKKRRALCILLLRHECLPQEHKILANAFDSSDRLIDSLAGFFSRIGATTDTEEKASSQLLAQAFQFYMQGMLSHFFQRPDISELGKHAEIYTRLFFRNLTNSHMEMRRQS